MVVSKRVSNAKSERFYKNSLNKNKKQQSLWQNFRKQMSAHPLIVAFLFFISVFGGVFSFFMMLPGEKQRLAGIF